MSLSVGRSVGWSVGRCVLAGLMAVRTTQVRLAALLKLASQSGRSHSIGWLHGLQFEAREWEKSEGELTHAV